MRPNSSAARSAFGGKLIHPANEPGRPIALACSGIAPHLHHRPPGLQDGQHAGGRILPPAPPLLDWIGRAGEAAVALSKAGYATSAERLHDFRELVRPWQDRASVKEWMSASRSSEPRGAQLPAQPHALSVRAVVFDVGETLIDETTEYGTWADWLGIPRHTFSAIFGAVIARGEDYRQTFQHFRPGFDLAVERLRREQASFPEHFDEGDLYPDARPCLEKLKQLGFLVGIAGNQTARAEALLRELQLPVDFIGTSDGWGAEKPSPAFFARIVTESGCAANEIAYVGDRLDNDIRPALAAGMIAVIIRRGPWGYINAAHPDAARADICIESLDELPERLTIKPSA